MIFAQYNKITVTEEEKNKYFGLIKNEPKDLEELLTDIKVLGKREVWTIMKWRGKIVHNGQLTT